MERTASPFERERGIQTDTRRDERTQQPPERSLYWFDPGHRAPGEHRTPTSPRRQQNVPEAPGGALLSRSLQVSWWEVKEEQDVASLGA